MNSILVVDDTPQNLQLLTQLLSDSGYEVRAVLDGAFALKSVQTMPPDVILLDIRMPGLDGYHVCEQLKADERTRDIPVIFLSALSDLSDKLKGFQVGGVDFISKPFQAEEVLARIETHLTLRNLRRDVERKNRQLQEEIQLRRQAEEEMRTLNEDLRASKQQLELTNQQLLEANASKDAFFSIIAHDLRSPFTSLIGLTETMLEDFDRYEQEKLKGFLRQIHKSAQQTYTLLSNLLTWSRLERGYLECQPENFPLKMLVEKNVWLAAPHAEQKQIALHHRILEDLIVFADQPMIDTVLRNLISNAVKFTKIGGEITIFADVHEHAVDVLVSDSGIGMEQAAIDTLFRIDQKSSRPGTAGEQGTGLGLILCKELVEKNHGHLRVASTPDQGSVFTVTLPLSA